MTEMENFGSFTNAAQVSFDELKIGLHCHSYLDYLSSLVGLTMQIVG